ncbi:hypothetical protein KIW84_015020 [Lathyrus oleraceus]|uniref:Pentatricopeptide repeat-containing protein n=1 Tax=Pisum sativum TaxID=3888 RepID=A0A9D5BPM1_PEA|nr:hypothetical protein KIW84_015018 [Pisum sativum]KAI5447396.1 hypothetical protein KIW84_015020 [Pisum sativum]
MLPSQATFVAATESCIGLRKLLCGECVHAKVINSKFEKLVSTHYCFDMIEEKNVFLGMLGCWVTQMFALLHQLCYYEKCFDWGCIPNRFSFSAVLKSSSISDLHQLHNLVTRMGYENHESVLSYLVMAYSKNGFINEALSFIQEFNSPIPDSKDIPQHAGSPSNSAAAQLRCDNVMLVLT